MVTKRSTAVVILTLPRSGSSALAGCLHRMGVDMGEGYFQPTDNLNPKGYYEDTRFRGLTNALTGYRYDIYYPQRISAGYLMNFEKLILGRSRKEFWGVKDTRMVFLFPYLAEIFKKRAEVKVITMLRAWDDIARSIQRHSQIAYDGQLEMTLDQAWELVKNWKVGWSESRKFIPPESEYQVFFPDLFKNPEKTLAGVWAFIYGEEPIKSDIEEAVKFIDQDLVHFVK